MTTMTPDEKLAAHEKLCAERYETIHHRLDRIEGMLNKLIWALVAGFIGLLVTTISNQIKAEEIDLPQLMYTPTDVGNIYLSIDQCPTHDIPEFYEYLCIATEEGKKPHVGCWNTDGSNVIVWWFDLNKPVAYDKLEFKPWNGPDPKL